MGICLTQGQKLPHHVLSQTELAAVAGIHQLSRQTDIRQLNITAVFTSRVKQKAALYKTHRHCHIRAHCLLGRSTVIRIHACRHVYCQHIFTAVVNQAANAQQISLQLTVEACAQKRVNNYVCTADSQLGQHPVILAGDNIHTAAVLRKHSQLAGSISCDAFHSCTHHKGTHLHAVACKPAGSTKAIAAVVTCAAKNNHAPAIHRVKRFNCGICHSLCCCIHKDNPRHCIFCLCL